MLMSKYSKKLIEILITSLVVSFCVYFTLRTQDSYRNIYSNLIWKSLPSGLAGIASTLILALLRKRKERYTQIIIISLAVNVFHEVQRSYFNKMPVDLFDFVAMFVGIGLAILFSFYLKRWLQISRI